MSFWRKTPEDLPETLALNRLPANLERTFWRVWLRARRVPELIGWLVDADGRPYPLRVIADWTGTSRMTASRHLCQLTDRGLLARDLAGRFFVPSVAMTEARHARRPASPTTASPMPATPTTSTTTSTKRPSRRDVENQPTLWGFPGPGVTLSGPDPPKMRHPLLIGTSEVRKGVRTADLDAVENPLPEGPALLGDHVALVPSEVEGDQHRYLLGKLAHGSERWLTALLAPRDRANLASLYARHPQHMLLALRAASEDPGAQANPLAWLNATVRILAAEVAS